MVDKPGAEATEGEALGQRRRGPSMADVARLAGVSSQTVSRVSNGSPGVIDETRRRVLAAMKELGYRPNSAARALKHGEFRTLGVILFNLSSTGNVRTLEAIAESAAESGYKVGGLIPDTCTAVFAANDQMALGLLRALHERGRRVPEDISVVGFDDIPEAAMFIPPLTTVHQAFGEVGRHCVDRVLHQIRNQTAEHGTTLVSTSLVERASTAEPPQRPR